MRIGTNPEKDCKLDLSSGIHRVIIPVYIPHQEGYFKDALCILKICLDSLLATTRRDTRITLIANGCCPDAVKLLISYAETGKVDQLVIHKANLGKVNAIIGVARGCFEPLLTFADADVMFRPLWEKAMIEVFAVFPQAGFVGLFPATLEVSWHCSSAAIFGAVSKGWLRYKKVVDDEDIYRFARSIGAPDRYKPEQLAHQLVAENKAGIACVGGGHFACTIRREFLAFTPSGPSTAAVSGGSEIRWLDEPPDKAGLWRLSTTRAVAWHLGNVLEPWMNEELSRLQNSQPQASAETLPVPKPKRSWLPLVIPWRLRQRFVPRLAKLFLKHKGK